MPTPLRRTGTTPLTSPPTGSSPTQKPASQPQATQASSWAPAGATRPGATGDGLDDLGSSALTTTEGLLPRLGSLKALPALQALGDGKATIDLPLKPGNYQVAGHSVTVKPGTVAHIDVQVHDGDLVPVSRQSTGTQVRIDPPLDLPFWVTGQGAKLVEQDAHRQFEVELGGWFDQHFDAKPLSELLSGQATPTKGGLGDGGTGSLGALFVGMTDLDHAKVDAKVTMRAAKVDLGGAAVAVDPATVFSVKGDGTKVALGGHVQLDDFALNQGGCALRGTGGAADLTATLTKSEAGYRIDSALSNLKLGVDSFQSTRPSALAANASDRLTLGKTQVTNGDLRFTTRVGTDGRALQVQPDLVSLRLEGSGAVTDAALTLKDGKDTASLAFSGSFAGRVDLGPAGLSVDAKLTGAHVDVGDLQETIGGNAVSLDHARADGEVSVKTDAKTHTVSIDGQAKNLDVLVSDYRGAIMGPTSTDLGKTSVTGAGTFHVGSDGLRVDGRLAADATIDAFRYDTSATHADLGPSTLSGELTHLKLGGGPVEFKVENAKADLHFDRAAFAVGNAARLDGAGTIKGTGTVAFDAKGFSVHGDTQVGVTLDDGRIHSSTVDLDLAKGSKASLRITDLAIGQKSEVEIKAGSTIDAVLDAGQLRVGGQTVDLAKGGRAQLDVKRVSVADGKHQVHGALKLDAKVSGEVGALDIPGLRLEPRAVDGRVKLSIDDVNLTDQKLNYTGANLSLDVKVGKVIGARTGQVAVGSLADPVAAQSVADVKAKSAAQLVGLTQPAEAAKPPIDALRLLKQGQVQVSVPLTGAVRELGVDLVSFPPGAKLDLALGVSNGQIVAGQTKASLTGVKALGVEVLGAHVDDAMRVHVDLKVAGRQFSLPIPGVSVPKDMNGLTDLATPKGTSSGSSVPGFVDLSHAQLDVTNATFGAGTLALGGGSVRLAEGSKLSFHGTPLAGQLVGNIGLDQVNLGLPQLALAGQGGRGDLKVTYRREGATAVVDADLSNLSLSTEALAGKDDRGDYLALGAGKLSGANLSFRSKVALTAAGLPRTDVLPTLESGALTLPTFSGDLQGGRISSTTPGLPGTTEFGPAHVDGAVTYTLGQGFTLKGTVDRLDAAVADLTVRQGAQRLSIDRARLRGQGGRVEIGNGKVAVDAKALAWDLEARELASQATGRDLRATRTHITGEGSFRYDSQKDLQLEGHLHVEGTSAGTVDLQQPRKVVIGRDSGVVVR